MPLVNYKCQNCGAALKVDESKTTIVCPYCESSFVRESTTNVINETTNIHAENLYFGDSFEQKMKAVNMLLDFHDEESYARAEEQLEQMKDKFPFEPELWWALIRLESDDFKKYDMTWLDKETVDYSETPEFSKQINLLQRNCKSIKGYKSKFDRLNGKQNESRMEKYDSYIERLQLYVELMEDYMTTKAEFDKELETQLNDIADEKQKISNKKMDEINELKRENEERNKVSPDSKMKNILYWVIATVSYYVVLLLVSQVCSVLISSTAMLTIIIFLWVILVFAGPVFIKPIRKKLIPIIVDKLRQKKVENTNLDCNQRIDEIQKQIANISDERSEMEKVLQSEYRLEIDKAISNMRERAMNLS